MTEKLPSVSKSSVAVIVTMPPTTSSATVSSPRVTVAVSSSVIVIVAAEPRVTGTALPVSPDSGDGERLIPLDHLVSGDRHHECLGLVRRPVEYQHLPADRGVVAPCRRPVCGRDRDRQASRDRGRQPRRDRHRAIALTHRRGVEGDRRSFVVGDRDRGGVGDIEPHRRHAAGQPGQRDGKHLIPLGIVVFEDRHRELLHLVRRSGERQHRGGRGVVAPCGRRPVRGRDRDHQAS